MCQAVLPAVEVAVIFKGQLWRWHPALPMVTMIWGSLRVKNQLLGHGQGWQGPGRGKRRARSFPG